jgi:glycosyltransferase involved in cell wall biosynthesis
MRLSIYTFVKNGLYQDYHVVDMLRHHLPLADEIVVNEGYSTDGTFERISRIDPKIKIFRSHWGQASSFDWFLKFKNDARQACTGDWCILLDCDEFIPEWEFDRLRHYLETTTDVLASLRLVNFYANYKVFHRDPDKVNWPGRKVAIHRNVPEVEVWGDGSNVRLRGRPADEGVSAEEFACHHFGFVRSAARLREKWRNLQGNLHNNRRKWFRIPSFVFNWFPHRWADPQFLPDLEVYEGPYLKAVRDNPGEFVRDGLSLYKLLKKPQYG